MRQSGCGEQGVAEPAISLAQTGNAPLLALKLSDDTFWSQRKDLLNGLSAKDPVMLSLAEKLRDIPPVRLLGWLQRWTYDLLSVRSGGPVRFNPDYHKVIAETAHGLRPIDLSRYHRELLRQQRTIHHPLNPRLYIEQLLLTYAAVTRGQRVRAGKPY
jgi:DNA polymerase-3 subunit delta'